MSQTRSGAQISKKAFLQAVIIIFILMMVSGILTRLIPAGQYARSQVDGREVIDPTSFTFIDQPDFPVWRWFTAPVEVLFTEDGLTKVIPIILFIVLVGTAFGVMDKSGILQAIVSRIVQKVRRTQVSLAGDHHLLFHGVGILLWHFRGGHPARSAHDRAGLLSRLGFPDRSGHVGPGHQYRFFHCHL